MPDSAVFELLVNWFPMLLIAAIWLFFIWRMKGTKGDFGWAELTQELRKQTRALERIAAALEGQSHIGGR